MAVQVRQSGGDLTDAEEAVLRLLNSAPVEAGVVRDRMGDPDFVTDLVRDLGGAEGRSAVAALVRVREDLKEATRRGAPVAGLDAVLDGVVRRPLPLSPDGLEWTVDGPSERLAAARAVIAWAGLVARLPGRLRPCGNDECELFLLDRSKGNTARWCSMAVCGNRMKARRHHARQSGARASR